MRLISHPILCNYYLTYRCNASCHFCDIWEKPSPYVDLENYVSNLKSLKRLGVRVIDFTGGEPLLHRKLPEMLELAHEYGFITTVTSNGLLYPKQAERLRGRIDMLHFSLDYFDAEKHDSARGVRCYSFVMNSIKIAKEFGERPDILMTVFPDNLSEIRKIYEHITQPNDLVLILNPAFSYNEIESGDFSNLDYKALKDWGKRSGVYLNNAFLELRKAGGNSTTNPVCKAASSTIVISPENKLVLPCYHLGIKEFPIHGDLHKLYYSKEVQRLVALEGKLPGCEGCTINCYMQPSFAVEVNQYFWKALPSTLKYNRLKGTYKSLFRRRNGNSKKILETKEQVATFVRSSRF